MVTFSDKTLDRTFAGLAHPIRRAIVAELAHRGTASVTELAEPFDVSLMAISKHVRVLEEAGLVLRQKEGRIQWCRLDGHALGEAENWLRGHRTFWEGQFEQLARYLTKRKKRKAGHS